MLRRFALASVSAAALACSLVGPAAGASAAPAGVTVTTSATATTVSHSGQWERQVRDAVNRTRRAHHMKSLKADRCLNSTAQAMARRSATVRKLQPMSKAEMNKLQHCFYSHLRFQTAYVRGYTNTNATRFVNSFITKKKGQMNPKMTHIGTGAYRDSRGMVWIAVIQTRTV